MATRPWGDLTRTQRRLIVTGVAIEVALTTIALVDLAKRPTQRVRGPKGLWAAACFVQPVGPIAYLALGRRTETNTDSMQLLAVSDHS